MALDFEANILFTSQIIQFFHLFCSLCHGVVLTTYIYKEKDRNYIKTKHFIFLTIEYLALTLTDVFTPYSKIRTLYNLLTFIYVVLMNTVLLHTKATWSPQKYTDTYTQMGKNIYFGKSNLRGLLLWWWQDTCHIKALSNTDGRGQSLRIRHTTCTHRCTSHS